jgi:hypothetical protein
MEQFLAYIADVEPVILKKVGCFYGGELFKVVANNIQSGSIYKYGKHPLVQQYIKKTVVLSTLACTVATTKQQPKPAVEPETAVSAKTSGR